MYCSNHRIQSCWLLIATRAAIAFACSTVVARAHADAPADKPQPRIWSPVVKIDTEVLPEVSGVVASRKYPGIFWAHSDSGNAPKIAAFDASGQRLCEIIIVAAPNIDWEDICTDDVGNLYIGDIGNNTGLLPVRYVYRIPEPDPYHPPDTLVTPDHHWRVRYGDVDRVNCEALFWRNGQLYVIAREHASGCRVFLLKPVSDTELQFEQVALLSVRGVSGADVSADGGTLLACSPTGAQFYALSDDATFIQEDPKRWISFPLIGAVEACCFFEDAVILVSERGDQFRVTNDDFDQHVRFQRPPRRRPRR